MLVLATGCDSGDSDTPSPSGECSVHADCAGYGDTATCAVDGDDVGVCVCNGALCDPAGTDGGGVATSSDGGTGGPTSPTTSSPTTADPTVDPSDGGDESSSGTGSEPTTGDDTGEPAGDNRWILEHFADDPVMTGDFTERTLVEMPRLVRDATGTNAKYAFTPRNEEGPDDKRVAFMNVTITDLVSSDAYGGGIGTSNNDAGVSMYLSNVYIEPNWPNWQNYDSTNYDGIVLDGTNEFYAEDLTIVNWNADSAIDIKAEVAQFSRFTAEGGGNRTLRFWEEGPHYIVESSVNNPTGAILWFRYCDATTVYVYDSTFNGNAEVPGGSVQCDGGGSPTFVYLDEDPRLNGDMHPMFTP